MQNNNSWFAALSRASQVLPWGGRKRLDRHCRDLSPQGAGYHAGLPGDFVSNKRAIVRIPARSRAPNAVKESIHSTYLIMKISLTDLSATPFLAGHRDLNPLCSLLECLLGEHCHNVTTQIGAVRFHFKIVSDRRLPLHNLTYRNAC